MRRRHGPLVIELNISKKLTCGLVTANCHNLRYVHSRLELSANTFMTQVMERQVSYARSNAQSVPRLSKRYIRDWKDAIRGLRRLIQMLE